MKRTVMYVLLGVFSYVAFLVVSFPAERAVSQVQAMVPQLRVAGVSGTALSGQISMLQFNNQRFQRVQWQFAPSQLLLGRIGFDLSFDGDGRRGSGRVGLRADGGMVLTDVEATLPLAEVAGNMTAPIKLNGLVNLKLEELALMNTTIEAGVGEVRWQRAGITAPVTQDFGDFVALLETDEQGIKAKVKDEQGPLEVDGDFRLSPDGNYQFTSKVSVRDPQQRRLQQGLQTIGLRQPDGKYTIEYSGKLN